jgi:hypothetical protein
MLSLQPLWFVSGFYPFNRSWLLFVLCAFRSVMFPFQLTNILICYGLLYSLRCVLQHPSRTKVKNGRSYNYTSSCLYDMVLRYIQGPLYYMLILGYFYDSSIFCLPLRVMWIPQSQYTDCYIWWYQGSVGLICGCMHPYTAYMACQSLPETQRWHTKVSVLSPVLHSDLLTHT